VFGVEFSEKTNVNRRLPLILGFAPTCMAGLMLSCSAAAAESGSWYVGAEIGADVSTTQNFNSGGTGVQNADNTGFLGGFSGGYTMANGLRPEIAFDYHYASISSIAVTSSGGISSPTPLASGSVSAKVLMGNLWYDFKRPDGFLSVIYPYVGLGIGMADVSLKNENFSTFEGTGGGANGSKLAPAYQFGFGGNWEIGSGLAATVGFRYLATTNVKISGEETTPTSTINGVSGIYRAPSLFVGMKYNFGGGES
jgi:opacity protein-like surface antigen